MIWLYAVVPGATRIPRARGAFREPLRLVRAGRVAGVVGKIPRLPATELSALVAHDRCVRRIFAGVSALLPARFGSHFPDERALRDVLAAREESLRDALGQVREREQMTLRLFSSRPLPVAPVSPRGGPGRRHLARLAASRAPSPVLAPVLQNLAALVDRSCAEPGTAAPHRQSVHHLLPRGRARRYRQIVASSPLPRGVHVHASGPFPPWAFTGGLG